MALVVSRILLDRLVHAGQDLSARWAQGVDLSLPTAQAGSQVHRAMCNSNTDPASTTNHRDLRRGNQYLVRLTKLQQMYNSPLSLVETNSMRLMGASRLDGVTF